MCLLIFCLPRHAPRAGGQDTYIQVAQSTPKRNFRFSVFRLPELRFDVPQGQTDLCHGTTSSHHCWSSQSQRAVKSKPNNSWTQLPIDFCTTGHFFCSSLKIYESRYVQKTCNGLLKTAKVQIFRDIIFGHVMDLKFYWMGMVFVNVDHPSLWQPITDRSPCPGSYDFWCIKMEEAKEIFHNIKTVWVFIVNEIVVVVQRCW